MRTEARAEVGLTPGADSRLPTNRYWVYALLVVAGVAWDLGSKEWVFRALGCPGQSAWEWHVPDVVRFRLHTNFNRGALWGLGQGWAPLFATLSTVAVAVILYVLFIRKHAHSLWLTVALGFVTAGALGNLYDRLGLHGWRDNDGPVHAVRDFLYFRFFETFDWAIFNFADSFLVTGAIMLVLHSMKHEHAASAKLDPLPAPSTSSPRA
uniref:Lipoprotein signal peptidase n=1 Tax=Schlesneria paludicola TaxID=360056 RepID=A0A7C2JZT5_9PLAN